MWCTHNPNMDQPMQFLGGNCRPFGKKCIRLTHVYTWDLLKGNPIFIYPSSSSSLPSPFQSHSLSHIKTPVNIPNLILIIPTQYLYPIQFLYHSWNHIIYQILLTIHDSFNCRQNSHMGRDACEGRHFLSHISCMPHWW